MLLGKDNTLKKVDLGLVHSSAAPDLATLVLNHLRQTDDLVTGVSPSFLVKHWPPAFTEWATKSVRDAFFASPQFPRILSADAIRDTITRGVANGLLAYVAKTAKGDYKPFCFNQALMTTDIDFSEEMFLITKETAEAYLKSKATPGTRTCPSRTSRPTSQKLPRRSPDAKKPADAEEAGTTHVRQHGLDRRSPPAEVDEVLHRRPVQVRRSQGSEAQAHGRDRPGRRHLQAEARRNQIRTPRAWSERWNSGPIMKLSNKRLMVRAIELARKCKKAK